MEEFIYNYFGISKYLQSQLISTLILVLALWIIYRIIVKVFTAKIDDLKTRYQWKRFSLYILVAIVFPALTGMTARVGLSGDLKDPSKSIPLGTITATISGMIVYVFIIIFSLCKPESVQDETRKLKELVRLGRLPVTEKNIEVLELKNGQTFKDLVNIQSSDAGLTIMGFHGEYLKHEGIEFFEGYDKIGEVLFVDAQGIKEIN